MNTNKVEYPELLGRTFSIDRSKQAYCMFNKIPENPALHCS